MVKQCYQIGSVSITIESDHSLDCSGLFRHFSVAETASADLLFQVRYVDKLPSCDGASAYETCLLLNRGDRIQRFYLDMRTHTPFAMTQQSGCCTQILILSSYLPWGTSVDQLFPLLALNHTLLAKDHLLMHGAFLTYLGNGLLFTGPSGIGKTTQSRLWQSRFGATAVNEDRTVLDLSGEPFRICGAPVAGSSPFCSNESAALKAIIMLAQGPENRIEQLPISKALRYLMGSVYLPASFESDQTACIDLLLRLCSTVPVYRLECRPDIASAELTYQTVFNEDMPCKTPT